MLNCTDETIDMEFNNFDLARFYFCGLHSLAAQDYIYETLSLRLSFS